MFCYTCGKQLPKNKTKYCDKSCSCRVSVINELFYKKGVLLTIENIKKEIDLTLTIRKLKDILFDKEDILYSLYQTFHWSKDFYAIIYCLKNEILEQPKCQCCSKELNYDRIFGYRKFCNDNKCKTHNWTLGFHNNLKILKNNTKIISKEELIKIIKNYTDRKDALSSYMVKNGLYQTIMYYSKPLDEIKNRKIRLIERMKFIIFDYNKIPLCKVCNINNSVLTAPAPFDLENAKMYSDWCSLKCKGNSKISFVYDNKTDAEKQKIIDKATFTRNNKSIEEKQEMQEKINATITRNGNRGTSTLATELFCLIDDLINSDDCFYHDLSKNKSEKSIRTNKSVKFVDFIYKNKIIEFFGDKVHSTPYKYRPLDKYNYPLTKHYEYAEDKWADDYQRSKDIIAQGYEMLFIWSGEYVNDKNNTIQKCLKYLMD